MIRSAGNHMRTRPNVALVCVGKGRTLQSAANEADINVIVGRFMKSGVIPQVTAPPVSQDFADSFDFQSSMNLLVAAKNAFMQLPADIRTRFNNDPARYVEFVSDERNLDEMRKLGIANPVKEPPKEPVSKVRMVDKEGNDVILRSDGIDKVKELLKNM